MDIWVFILVSIGITLIPGPNVLVILSTSITQGKTRGLQTVAGTSVAMIIQLLIAALGTSYLVTSLAQGFVVLKWTGVIYLLYVGLKHLYEAWNGNHAPAEVSASGSFKRGFIVSLTNPKTILFFSAFLPQFAVASEAYLPQIALLSFIFWLIAIVLDSIFAVLSSKLSGLIHSKNLTKYQNGFSGALYCSAATLLAGSKNA